MNKALLRRMVLALAVGMPCAMLSGSAMGETTTTMNMQAAAPAPAPAPAEPANTLSINGLVGIDFVTAYVTRGVVLENQGFIAQPYGELQFKLAEGGDFVNKVSGLVGIWNSLHSEHTDQGLADGGANNEGADPWYEFDWYVGLSVDLAKNWNLTWVYQEFISPNDGFNTNDNTQLKLSFNDAGLWGDSGFALKPYGLVFIELDNKAGTGSDEGIYTEFGIEPAWTLGESGVTLSVPAKIGLGWDDFYEEDEEFGFASIGAKLSTPLKFMPAKYGAWSAYVSVEYMFLGDGVDDFNDASVHTDDDIIVGKAGVSFTF